jgi:hypothetical protein
MATNIKDTTIADTYKFLVKRDSASYTAGGENIEIQNDSGVAVATGLYLASGTVTSNVGIGIASPVASLHIDGGVNAVAPSSSTTSNAMARFELTGQDLALDIGCTTSGSNRVWLQARGDIANLATDAHLTLQETGGNVGIGTAAPDTLLTLADATNPILTLSRGTDTAEIAIADGYILGQINFSGHDNGSYEGVEVGAFIRGEAGGNWDSNDVHDAPAELQFFTQSDGDTDNTTAPRMTIDHAGRVGIGTTAPSNRFTVKAESTTGTGENLVVVTNYDDTNAVILGKDASDDGYVNVYHGDDSQKVLINSNGDSYFIGGNVGIGTASPSHTFHVFGDPGNDSTLVAFQNSHPTGDADDDILFLQYSSDADVTNDTGEARFIRFGDNNHTNMGSIIADSGIAISSTLSDYRKKENISLMSSGLTEINNLKPSTFNFKGYTKVMNGFIAHEVQEVISGAVFGAKDAVDDDGEMKPQMLATEKLIPFMVKAIQELSAKVTALEGEDSSSDTKIAALEAKDVASEASITALEAEDVANKAKVATLETEDVANKAKIVALEAKDTEYATTITALTARITALESA